MGAAQAVQTDVLPSSDTAGVGDAMVDGEEEAVQVACQGGRQVLLQDNSSRALAGVELADREAHGAGRLNAAAR